MDIKSQKEKSWNQEILLWKSCHPGCINVLLTNPLWVVNQRLKMAGLDPLAPRWSICNVRLPHFSEIQYFIWLRIARYRGLLDGLGNIWIQERSSPSTFLLSLQPSTLLSYKISLSTIHAPKCTCSINTVTTLTPNNPHNQVRSGCRRELPHSGTAPKLPSCSSPTLPSSSPCKASTSTFWEGCQGVVSALLKKKSVRSSLVWFMKKKYSCFWKCFRSRNFTQNDSYYLFWKSWEPQVRVVEAKIYR